MPKVNDMIPSKYFRLADFDGGREEKLTIYRCSLDEMGDGESKWVIWFEENKHGLVLNKTNIRTLGDLFGDDTDDWLGHVVVLTAGRAKGISGTVPALLVKEPRPDRKPKAAPQPDEHQPAAATAAGRHPVPPMTQEEVDSAEDIPF